MRIICLIAVLVVFVAGGAGFAETVSSRDKYYDGLSEIIEENMDNPQYCLKRVESFLNNSKKLIDGMIKEQITALEKPIDYVPVRTEDVKITPQARFNRAMNKFSKQYPQEGEKIMFLNIRALIPPIEDNK